MTTGSTAPMPSAMPVSALILARNEEEQIADCILAVRDRVDEVLVIDMESEDATASVATSLGARVLSHPRITNFDAARTPGIRAARNEWILVIDADEHPTPALLETLREMVAKDSIDAAYLPRANLAFSGFSPREANFPEMHLRFFRRSSIDLDGYSGRIHSVYRLLPGARATEVQGSFPDHCLLHYTNPTIEFLWEKVNRYTSEEARDRYAAGQRIGIVCLWRSARKFIRRWLFSGSFREGWHGFWLCWVSGVYEALVHAKLWEMSLHQGRIPDTRTARARMRSLAGQPTASSLGDPP